MHQHNKTFIYNCNLIPFCSLCKKELVNEGNDSKGIKASIVGEWVLVLSPVYKAYLCIYCRYMCWSGKGPVRCLSPSLLSAVDGWLCWPVAGLLEFWRGCNQKNKQVLSISNHLRRYRLTQWAGWWKEKRCWWNEWKKVWGVCGWPTVGPAEFSWGLLLWLRGGFGELGGVREEHTRWSIWYSSCCRRKYSSLSNRVQVLHVQRERELLKLMRVQRLA